MQLSPEMCCATGSSAWNSSGGAVEPKNGREAYAAGNLA